MALPERGILKSYTSSFGQRSDRLAVFAHSDRWNRVDEYVFRHLRHLADLGVDLLFISTASSLNKEDVARLLEVCFEVWVREKEGHYFASYQAGIQGFGADSRYRQVLLINDGVYGPFYPLAPIFAEMDSRKLDVWSMTDSLQHEYHLQSYFLAISRQSLDHERVQEFWNRRRFRGTAKQPCEQENEIAFSQVCKGALFRVGAWVDYRQAARKALEDTAHRLERLRESRAQGEPLVMDAHNMADVLAEDRLRKFTRDLLVNPCDPSHELWNYLIQDFGHPFLRVDLMRRNPEKVLNLWMLDSVIPKDYPLELIENHLKRVG